MKKYLLLSFAIAMMIYSGIGVIYAKENPYENLEVNRVYLNDDFINYYVLHKQNNQDTNSKGLIIYLTGSGMDCALGLQQEGVWQNEELFIKSLNKYLSPNFDILVPEKMNIKLGNDQSDDPKVFEHYTLEERVSSAVLVIDTFLEKHQYNNVYLMGVSEGGQILPMVYNNLRTKNKIAKLVVLGSGGLSQYEEFKILQKSTLPMPQPYRELLMEADNVMEAIRSNQDVHDKWYAGYPYKHWAGFFPYHPLDDFVKINVPIFLMQGTKDTSAPIESSRAFAAEFKRLGKNNLTYVENKNEDHRFNGNFKAILKKIEYWLLNGTVE
ncbi:MAG: alpha/beta hydrolase [Massilibacillus sp.]|nr:alpha/beta hydrolase [Massilibacillus sp.]